jgi:ATP-dependent protease ClpP protease subunit
MKKLSKVLLFLAMLALPLGSAPTSADESVRIVVLSSSNTVVLNSVVDGDSVGNALEQIRKLDHEGGSLWAHARYMVHGAKAADPIYLFLATPGGSVESGLELIEGVNGMVRPVETITSFAASMGMQIAQSVKGDRLILEHGIMMSHRGSGEFSGQFGGSEPSQSFNRYRIWAQRLKEMDEQTVKRTNGKQTLASYQRAYDQELWVTGSEAVKQGYADRITKVRCDSSLDGVETHTISFMGLPIEYDLDKCPINSSPRNIRIVIDVIVIETNKGSMDMKKFKKLNGGFGALCLQESATDSKKVCALDTTFSYEKLDKVKEQFIISLENKRNQALPFTF